MSNSEALTPFQNEPFTDFSQPIIHEAMEKALEKVTKQLGQTYAMVIDGKSAHGRKTFTSINPSRSSEVVGVFSEAERTLVDRALASATRTFEHWSRVRQENRAQILRRIAENLRQSKLEFMAWM